MPQLIRCPNAACGTTMKVPDDAAGKPVRCPKCQQAFLVGAPAREPVGAAAPAARDDYEFPFTHDGFVIAELHAQSSFNDEKQLILVFMMVPDEFAFELHGFDVAVIHFTEDARVAVIGEAAKFFFEIDRVHDVAYRL